MLQEHTFNVHTTNKIILLQNEYKEWEFSNFHGIRGDSDLFVFAAPVCVCVLLKRILNGERTNKIEFSFVVQKRIRE